MDIIKKMLQELIRYDALKLLAQRHRGRVATLVVVGLQEGLQIQLLVKALALEDRPGKNSLDVDVTWHRVCGPL